MGVQKYPYMISIYKDADRYLINPDLVTVGSFRSNAPWLKFAETTDDCTVLGNAVIEAVEYIKNSPILDIQATIDEIGEFIYWKKEGKYPSWGAFDKKNICITVKLNENGTYEIYSMKKLPRNNGYSGCIKEHNCDANASSEEIGLAVIDVAVAAEEFYNKNKPNPYPPKTIELLNDSEVIIEAPRDKHFNDYEDCGAAELHQAYLYFAKEGAEPSAAFYLGIAAELDCDMNEDNIRRAWEKLHGKAELFEVKSVEHGIFKLRAEMRNKSVHRISYLLQIDESGLLDCTMELHKPNTRKKLDEKLTVMFEEFARQCRFKE